MIQYQSAPLRPATRNDWRANPYLCGVTNERPIKKQNASRK